MCKKIGFPVAEDKTEWASELLVFLGVLLNGRFMLLGIPEEKRARAVYLLQNMIDRTKTMVKDLQVLCGYLNFLCRAIFPGRVFTRRMYAKYSNITNNAMGIYKLKQYTMCT